MRSSIIGKTVFLLLSLRIALNQILMGAPIGCPNRLHLNRPNFRRSRHVNWGTHKSRTRGSVWKARRIVSD